MILHHQRVQAGAAPPGRWILFLHGIFGAGRNWASVARSVVAARPEWGVALVDLRQHGASVGFPPPHTLRAAASDLRGLVEAEGIEADAVLGHSFGGKVALVYAREPARPPGQLWLVDSSPGSSPPGGSAWEVLQVLRRVPASYEERAEGVRALESEGVSPEVARWMTTNLVRGPDQRWRWRIDPDDMEALLRDFFATDAWDVVEAPPPGLDVHVVKAEASSVLDDAAAGRVEDAGRRTARVHLHRVQGGHWLNADNPDALVGLLTERLAR